MNKLPTAAEARKLSEALGNQLAFTDNEFEVIYRAQCALLQFAKLLADREEMARIMAEANEAKFERGTRRAKFEPCCDGTDYRCSICGGIVRYDGTPPEAE